MQITGSKVTIGTNVEHTDKVESIHILSATQNNTQVNMQPQVTNSSESVSNSGQAESSFFRPVYFNKSKEAVSKVDLCRVVMSLLESGCFVDASGCRSRQEDVFAALGQMLNSDFHNYDKTLSEGRKKKLPITIFENLEKAFMQYESDKE